MIAIHRLLPIVLTLLVIWLPVSSAQPAAAATPREVTVRPLYYSYTRPPSGGMGSTRIENHRRAVDAADWQGNTLSLAISENLPRGAGDMLRVAAWIAAVSTGRIAGDPLIGHSFTLDVKGLVDGPSAGVLYAVGMLATLRGDGLLPDVTMTGALMPGGSIGAVGGIQQKLDAAKNGGMRKIVLPESQRIDFQDDGNIIDVADYASQIGVEVVFVSNLQEAYYEMTGKTLARRGIAPRGEVTLPTAMMDTIRSRTQQRFGVLNKVLDGFGDDPRFEHLQQRPAAERETIRQVIGESYEGLTVSRSRALALMQEGEWVAAYDTLAGAILDARALVRWRNDKYRIDTDEQLVDRFDRDITGIMEHRQKTGESHANLPVESALLEARSIRDLLDLSVPLRMTETFDLLLASHDAELKKRPKGFFATVLGSDEERELQHQKRYARILKTLLAYRYRASREMLDQAATDVDMLDPDFLAAGLVFRETPRPVRPLNLQRTREWAAFADSSYRAVSDVLAQVLETQDEDEYLEQLFDPAVRRAMALDELAAELAEDDAEAGDDEETAMTARDWFLRAVFITQEEIEMNTYLARVGLGQYSSDGGRHPLLRGGSLRRLLDQASENARQAVLNAQRAGHQVIGPRYDYLLAQGLRSGDSEDQFKALRFYWSAAALCQLVDLCTQP